MECKVAQIKILKENVVYIQSLQENINPNSDLVNDYIKKISELSDDDNVKDIIKRLSGLSDISTNSDDSVIKYVDSEYDTDTEK
jgi:hypothetical protein